MKKVKAFVVGVLTFAAQPEFRPLEVKYGRVLLGVVTAYLGYRGYKAA